MDKRHWQLLCALLMAFGMIGVTLLTTLAAGGSPWVTTTLSDFAQGAMDSVDIWSVSGTVQLDRDWMPDHRVNDALPQDALYPRLTFVLTNTGGTTRTVFMAVWEDQHIDDHYRDVYFDRSINNGRTWGPDVLIEDGGGMGSPHQLTPDIAPRRPDGSLWVVWQDTRNDAGDIYYTVSHDHGGHWVHPVQPVYVVTGTQLWPRIGSQSDSGDMLVAWEDERSDDGDIYLSRHSGSTWSTPVKVSDDTTGAEQREPSLAVDGSGNAYLVWLDERGRTNDTGDIYFSRWMSGTTWGDWSTNVLVSDSSMDYATGPAIVAGPNDVVYAAWVERVPTGPATYDFQVVVARSDDNGDTWTRSVVSRLSGGSATGYSYSSPALGVHARGRVFITWLRGHNTSSIGDILFSQSPDEGQHWTEPRYLTQPPGDADRNSRPAIAADFGGHVVVAWQDYRERSAPQVYASGYPGIFYQPEGGYRSPSYTVCSTLLVEWGAITWTGTTPSGTAVVVATRVGSSTGWTEWVTHTTSGEALSHPPANAIQYRVFFSTAMSSTVTPQLHEVIVSFVPKYPVLMPVVLKGS